MRKINLKSFISEYISINEIILSTLQSDKTIEIKGKYFTALITSRDISNAYRSALILHSADYDRDLVLWQLDEFFHLVEILHLIPKEEIQKIKTKVQNEEVRFLQHDYFTSCNDKDTFGLSFIIKSFEHISLLAEHKCFIPLDDYFANYESDAPFLTDLKDSNTFRKENEDSINFLELVFKK